jgi:hypothetical protein
MPSPGFPAWSQFVPSFLSLTRGRKNIPPPLDPVVGDTINIPLGEIARVKMTGQDDDGITRGLEDQRFGYGVALATLLTSSNNGVFTIGPDDPPDPAVAVITSVGPGTAGLVLSADADLGPTGLLLQKILTVNVYSIATRIALFYTAGGNEIQAAFDVIKVPLNETTTVRVEGRDDLGNVIVLQGTVWQDDGVERYSLSQADPPDVNKRVLTPISIGSLTLPISADGDPSAGTSMVYLFPTVSVLDPLATHLVASAGIQNP